MQNWFSGGGGGGDDSNLLPKTLSASSSSLLANWNSYAATKGSDLGSGSIVGSFDIESAVRSANDTVSGTFNVVSRGVSNIPGNLQSATSNIPSGKSLYVFWTSSCIWRFLHFYSICGVPSCDSNCTSEICSLLHGWMWLYNWVILHA